MLLHKNKKRLTVRYIRKQFEINHRTWIDLKRKHVL